MISSKEIVMAESENPYQPPSASDEPQASQQGTGVVTAATRVHFGKASPWLRFAGVMGYIGSISSVVFGVIFGIVALASGKSLFGSTAQSAITGPALALFYLGIGVVLFFPARYIQQMGKLSKLYVGSGDELTLESIALNLKRTVKFYGISTIVTIAAVLVFAVAAGIIAAVSTLSH
jgi:hypothetical protein